MTSISTQRLGAWFRAQCWIAGFAAAVILISVLSLYAFPKGSDGSFLGAVLLDRYSESLRYPFTIQNGMWVVFFLASSELVFRYLGGRSEKQQLARGLLPEDGETLLRPGDLPDYYAQMRTSDPNNTFWLQRCLSRAILQFQTSLSADRANSILNSSMDLFHHEMELRYGLVRYFVWLIPTIGFIGTVIGIAFALQGAAEFFASSTDVSTLSSVGGELMVALTRDLGVAFYTTLLALVQSSVLMLTLHFVQGQEEGALNAIGQYCLDNFINRLFETKTP